MIGVIAFFAGLVLIGTVVDVILNILHLDDVFSESFVQKFQGFSLYTNTIKLFNCPEPGASGSLDCINGIRLTKNLKSKPPIILKNPSSAQVSFYILGSYWPLSYEMDLSSHLC